MRYGGVCVLRPVRGIGAAGNGPQRCAIALEEAGQAARHLRRKSPSLLAASARHCPARSRSPCSARASFARSAPGGPARRAEGAPLKKTVEKVLTDKGPEGANRVNGSRAGDRSAPP